MITTITLSCLLACHAIGNSINNSLKEKLLEIAINEFRIPFIHNIHDLEEYNKYTNHDLILLKELEQYNSISDFNIYLVKEDEQLGKMIYLAHKPKNDEIYYLAKHYFPNMGHDYVMVENLNHIIQSNQDNVMDYELALNVLYLYFQLYYADVRYILLNQYSDIESGELGSIPTRIQEMVQPIQVHYNGDRYTIIVFTWEPVGGVFKNWEFQINQSGVINVQILYQEKNIGVVYIRM